MAEPTTTREPVVYRPISTLAILGMILSGIYALLVVTSLIATLVYQDTLFLPPWSLVLAVVGGGVSYYALVCVRNSEGTLAGEGLSRTGLWLAGIVGLGYVAFYLGTGYAIQTQANAFLMEEGQDGGFFPALVKGEVNRAFLMTLPYYQRSEVNPDDIKAMETRFDVPNPMNPDPSGSLTRFREHEIVQTILQAKGDVKVTPLGVKKWSREKDGYEVARNYRISTPELHMDITTLVKSTDSDAPGSPRKWYMYWPAAEPLLSSEFTPLGSKVEYLRNSSRNFFNGYLGRPDPNKTVPPDKTDYKSLGLPNDEFASILREDLKSFLSGNDPSPTPRFMGIDRKQRSVVRQAGDHVEVVAKINIPVMPQIQTKKFMVTAEVTARSKEPVSIESPPNSIQWEPVSVEIKRLMEMPEPKQAGM